MIRLGTAGFSYQDWAGTFYPPGLPEREWLAYYAREFSFVELNVTFYRLPAARTVAAWVERTPADFAFAVKAFRGLTHEREAPDFAAFRAAVQPLVQAGKLACVLAQFPQSFHPTPENNAYLAQLRDGLADLPAVVEFRDAAWAAPATFERLRALGLGFASVDEPRLKGLMPPVAEATGPVAYVRFHGRNAARWYRHQAAWERYDYAYSRAELAEWAPRLRALEAETGLALACFNNTPRAQAVDSARLMKALLGL